MTPARFVALFASFALASCAGSGTVPSVYGSNSIAALHAPMSARLAITPRLQWLGNYGYCGEVSLITAGLYYGQYLSQYDARALASPGVPQSKVNSQLLLGVNDGRAAKAMHLQWQRWATDKDRSNVRFLEWIRRNVERGYPVAIGIFTNEYLFYGSTNPNAGSSGYDHIVPVLAAKNAAITFSDNGLYGTNPRPGHWRPLSTYRFTYAFDAFPRTRSQANAPTAPPYSLPKDDAKGGPGNFGIAILGVADPNHETLRVEITTSKYYEWPPIRNGSSVRPTPEKLDLTVNVSGLKPGIAYNLYRYDRFSSVPDADFNAHATQASQTWRIAIRSGTSYVLHQSILSDQTAVYRAVPASGR